MNLFTHNLSFFLSYHHTIDVACLAGEVHSDADNLLSVHFERKSIVGGSVRPFSTSSTKL